MSKRWSIALVGFAVALSTACEHGREVEPSPPPTTEPGTFTLDFAASQNGGITVGQKVNLAFALNTSKPLRTYALQSSNSVSAEGLRTSFDYADCQGAISQLEQQVKDLAPGTPASVASFDVELLGPEAGLPPWEGSVCFGYRDPSGVWHWKFSTTPITLDPVDKRWRARVPVEAGPLDAIKVVFHAVPKQPMARVTYRVKDQ